MSGQTCWRTAGAALLGEGMFAFRGEPWYAAYTCAPGRCNLEKSRAVVAPGDLGTVVLWPVNSTESKVHSLMAGAGHQGWGRVHHLSRLHSASRLTSFFQGSRTPLTQMSFHLNTREQST